MRREETGGFVLLGMCVVAMVCANIPALAESWRALWELPLVVTIGDYALKPGDLQHWINDGLMVLFFFVVGLEIKGEMVGGHLSTFRRASLPVLAAAGGMLVPALIFIGFNLHQLAEPAGRGWGIPVATDIAFAIGVMALLGSRVPVALKVFLVAIAIADDLGAVLVIAVGYTDPGTLNFGALGVGGGLLLLSVAMNLLGVRHPVVYALIGVALWLAFLESGVHATVAGVLLAFTIPARSQIPLRRYIREQRRLVDELEAGVPPGETAAATPVQREIVEDMERNAIRVESPVERLAEGLHPWVTFGIMPVFALANAGVEITDSFLDVLMDPVSLGIILGLLVGKQVGVTLAAWLAVKLRLSEMPAGATWRQVYGVAWLAGIGFTMSLFIANLAYPDLATAVALEHAKVAILVGSLLSGIGGFTFLWLLARRKRPHHTT